MFNASENYSNSTVEFSNLCASVNISAILDNSHKDLNAFILITNF